MKMDLKKAPKKGLLRLVPICKEYIISIPKNT